MISARHRRDPPLEVRAGARQLLGMPPARFLRDYWQKRPLLIRNAFAGFAPPLSPDELAGLACEPQALARFVLRKTESCPSLLHGHRRNDEQWEVRTGPFDDDTFVRLPSSHWTLLVQDVDKWDAKVGALLERFDFLPSWRIDDVMVSYATNGGGVGAHVDQYDVFLLQGIGQRRWRISTDPRAPHDFRDDVELKVLKRFSPTHGWTLEPGDMLYLPPGVPHDGTAIGECMTFSIGMRAPSNAELLVAFAEEAAARLPDSRRYADPELQPVRASGEIDAAALRRASAALGPAAQMLEAQAFADFFGRFVTAYRGAGATLPPKRKMRPETLAAELSRSRFQRDPWSRFAWRRAPRGAVLYVDGGQYPCPSTWARALCGGHALDGAQLASLPARAAGVMVLADLINAGNLSRHSR